MPFDFSTAIDIIFSPPYLYLFILGIGLLALGIIGRLLGGFRPGKTAGITASACFSMIFVYVVAIAAFGAEGHSKIFAAALPFIGELSDGISLLTLIKTDFLKFMLEVTKVFFLSLTVALSERPAQKLYSLMTRRIAVKISTAIPLFLMWYFVKCIVVFAGIIVNALVDMGLDAINETYGQWIPVVMLGILAALFIYLVLGFFLKGVKKITKLFVNPFSEGLKWFFGENDFGKILKSTFLTTLIIVVVMVVLDLSGALTSMMDLAIGTTVFTPVAILIVALGYLVWVFCF